MNTLHYCHRSEFAVAVDLKRKSFKYIPYKTAHYVPTPPFSLNLGCNGNLSPIFTKETAIPYPHATHAVRFCLLLVYAPRSSITGFNTGFIECTSLHFSQIL
ncbi:unnamed protein product [Ceratitis capitata]|uniref:(Mediterranean fruit fly) hypothetical protein n=1 Tax=Ceratitis capitata TaxID=7213 RepID=A0A811V493_CERCA|nr:unnamed protein product [Ceratitis capitata]